MTTSFQIPVKAAPHSKESEMMVLGCMMSSVNALNIASEALDSSDFYFVEHRPIFDILKELFRNDRPADLHIVSEELKKKDQLKAIGGVNYLVSLVQYAGTSAHIEEYAAIIKDKSILRSMIQTSQIIEKKALQEPDDVDQALDEAQSEFFKISQKRSFGVGIEIKEILSGLKATYKTPYLKELERRQEEFQKRGGKFAVTGIETGFLDLDKLINGFEPSNLIILAARPAMGKTALAINVAEHIALKQGLPVGVFSLEMSAEQLLHRLISSQSEVESDKIRLGSLSGMEYQRIVEAVHKMQKYTIVIDDQPGLKVSDLRARARRMKERYGIQFLVIDYLQLLSGSGSFRGIENRQSEISEISRMLKNLARELNIPVLCLSQLSRKVEERPGHRPMMSDLRESGSIEQDSDIVLFLLRHEYYEPGLKPGIAELIVAKNRHGAIGSVNLHYRKEFAQFANLKNS